MNDASNNLSFQMRQFNDIQNNIISMIETSGSIEDLTPMISLYQSEGSNLFSIMQSEFT
jgi:hypothetical protein